MLITQSNIKKNNLNMLLDQLPVLESTYWNAKTVSIVESFSGNLLDLKTLDEFATYNGMSNIDAFITVCESSDIHPRNVKITIDGWRVIENQQLLEEVTNLIDNGIEVLIKPLSKLDPVSILCDKYMNVLENTGCSDLLDSVLNEDFDFCLLMEQTLDEYVMELRNKGFTADQAKEQARTWELSDIKQGKAPRFGGASLHEDEKEKIKEVDKPDYQKILQQVTMANSRKGDPLSNEEVDSLAIQIQNNTNIKTPNDLTKFIAEHDKIGDNAPVVQKTNQQDSDTAQSDTNPADDASNAQTNISNTIKRAKKASKTWRFKALQWLHGQAKKYQMKVARLKGQGKASWYQKILSYIAGATRSITSMIGSNVNNDEDHSKYMNTQNKK